MTDTIRVSRTTGLQVEHPSDHHHAECYSCMIGDTAHVEKDWEDALEITVPSHQAEKAQAFISGLIVAFFISFIISIFLTRF